MSATRLLLLLLLLLLMMMMIGCENATPSTVTSHSAACKRRQPHLIKHIKNTVLGINQPMPTQPGHPLGVSKMSTSESCGVQAHHATY